MNEYQVKELVLDDGQVADVLMREDGYTQATKLFQAACKRLDNWKRSHQTKHFIKLLAEETGLKENDLIESKRGGYDKNLTGTWVHPRLATHMALWISTGFCMQVTKWVEEWMKHKKENTDRFLRELGDLKPDPDDLSIKEKAIQARLLAELGGEVEVETPVGFVDILTADQVIEIKHAKCWKHAVGQVLMYGRHYPCHAKRIHLFGTTEPDALIEECCNDYNILVTYE